MIMITAVLSYYTVYQNKKKYIRLCVPFEILLDFFLIFSSVFLYRYTEY